MAVCQQNGESAGRVGNQVSRMHLTLTPENTFLMNRMKTLHKKKKITGIFSPLVQATISIFFQLTEALKF